MAIALKDLNRRQLKDKMPAAVILAGRSIDDDAVIEHVRDRALAFQVSGMSMPLAIHDELVFDVGARQPNGSHIGVAIKIDDDMRQALKEKIGVSRLRNDTCHVFFSIYKRYDAALSRYQRGPVFRYAEFCTVLVSEADNTGVFIMGERGVKTVFYGPRAKKTTVDPNVISRIYGDPGTRYFGLHSHMPFYENGVWKAARYSTVALLPKRLQTADQILQSGRIAVGKLESVSDRAFASARFLGLALNMEAHRPTADRVRARVQRDRVIAIVNRDTYTPGNPGQLNSCTAMCDLAFYGTITAASVVFKSCAVTTAATIFGPPVCGLVVGGAIGLAAALHHLCVDNCNDEWGPQPEEPVVGMNDDPDDPDNNPDNPDNDPDDPGLPGDDTDPRDHPLPIEMTVDDPFEDRA
jgi:hypothetical protein